MLARLGLFNGRVSDDTALKLNYRNDIRNNLKTLRVSDHAIQKILNTVDAMPAAEHMLGALKFLTTLTDKKSVCEDYYLHSDYIAEFFCTISNLGFFAVAWYYNDYATLLAGIFSTVSHAIPLKRLNELDKLAAVAVFLKVLSHYDVLATNPAMIVCGALTFAFGALDLYAGRKHKEIFGPVFHVAWHLSAAFALYKFNQAQEIAAADAVVNINRRAFL